jgi:hypothetical protein
MSSLRDSGLTGIDTDIDDSDDACASDFTAIPSNSSASSSTAAIAADTSTHPSGLAAPVRGQKSVPNSSLGDRRNLQDIAHVAFGIAVEHGGAMRAAINSGRVRLDGHIYRKSNRFFRSVPGSLIELLEPEPSANVDLRSCAAAKLDADAGAGAGTAGDSQDITRAHKRLSQSELAERDERMAALHAAIEKISAPPTSTPASAGIGRRVMMSSVVRATTLMMNKPHECVTAMSDARHTTVMGMLRVA